MMRKLFLILMASLIFFSCGIPNYFSYSDDDFEFNSVDNNSFEVYVDSSIVNGVSSGQYVPLDDTPRLYLMYAIYGTSESPSSASSTLRSAMNSKFKGKVGKMPDERLSKYYRYALDGENYVYYYVYPFKQVKLTDTGYSVTSTYTGTLDFDYFYYTGNTAYLSIDMVQDPSSSSGRLMRLTISDGGDISDEIYLSRLNKESFTKNISNYNDDDDDEFDEDDKLSEMMVPSIHVFAAVSFGFYSYTNLPYISAKEIASFSFNDDSW